MTAAGPEVYRNRTVLVGQVAQGGNVPRPERWTGYRLTPELFEFWTDRPHRLHERRSFVREGDAWREGLLYP